MKNIYVNFGDISAQSTIERLVELLGIEAVKSAVDEIAAQQSVQRTATPPPCQHDFGMLGICDKCGETESPCR